MNPPNPQGLPHPPRPFYEHPITFVRSETQGEVHVFLPDSFDLEFVREIANNFRYRHWFGANENAHEIDNVSSHSVQQQVLVYHDSDRNKFRLCPGSNGLILEGGQTGQFVLLCGKRHLYSKISVLTIYRHDRPKPTPGPWETS